MASKCSLPVLSSPAIDTALSELNWHIARNVFTSDHRGYESAVVLVYFGAGLSDANTTGDDGDASVCALPQACMILVRITMQLSLRAYQLAVKPI